MKFRATFGLMTLMVLSGVLGGFIAIFFFPAKPAWSAAQEELLKSLEAGKLEILDKDKKVRISLGFDELGHPRIQLLDAEGKSFWSEEHPDTMLNRQFEKDIEVVKTDSGLRYQILKKGDGDKTATPKNEVTVHYRGWLADGTEFDSSYKRDEPATFVLSKVIKGWTEGVSGMKIGEKRRLVIPSNLGYGDTGASGVIPPKATLIFDVELLKIND